MIRIDMSEFMEKHSVSKLVGSPPGYVGYDDGSQITEKIRKKPYSVILFDEIEKAHPDVFHILLQILEDGHITDGQGRRVDMKNCVIIMTSNAGARLITEKHKLGFGDGGENKVGSDYDRIKSDVMGELKKTFRPEFLNRIDDVIVFHQLTQEDMEKIAAIMLSDIKERLKGLHIQISFDKEVLTFLSKKGFDPLYGARPMRREILSQIEDVLAEKMLGGEVKGGDKLTITERDGKLAFVSL